MKQVWQILDNCCNGVMGRQEFVIPFALLSLFIEYFNNLLGVY